MSKIKTIFQLFITMLKIGLFTFGGGYAMIHVFDHEFVEKKKWLTSEEFMDLVVIAESTPGPIAINSSTYIGYKQAGFLGSLFATIGMCVPSFTIIYIISLFLNRFLEISAVAAAFKGIQVCVVYLILSAGLKLFKKMKKTPFNLTVVALTFVAMVTLSLLSASFSTIFYILIFGLLGLVIYTVRYIKGKREEEGKK